ncbi:hypothetical protein [Brevundimonas sp.]|jgi:hypothetical protein|uniref:hypothetical protein n=1 Tax=Brevundimonas sp. TaxID=1871086 RepID=UPI003783F14D
MKTLLMLVGLTTGLATPTLAQTRQAEATVTIERSVGVSEISRMVFNASSTQQTATATATAAPPPEQTSLMDQRGTASDAPAVIRISGDPGRAYRVNLPGSIAAPQTNATITGFSVWSQNSGDITSSLTARMDGSGRDTLHVTGFLSSVAFTNVTAAVPIVVNYE